MEIFENNTIDECLKASASRIRKLYGDIPIHGFVTVEVIRKNGDVETIMKDQPNLLTQDGRDLFHAQCYTNTAAGTRGSGFIAVSADVVAPVATDTTLVGEIAAGGLSRADADTKTHTDNTNISTIQHTFTATAAHTAVHKSGMFNAASGVTLTHAAVFATDVTLATDDQLRVTWTLTMG